MANHRKPQRESFNSVNSQVKANMDSDSGIPVPVGYSFSSEVDLAVWSHYTSLRLASDWRDTDLLALAKCVVYEKDIREASAIIDRDGIMVDKVARDGSVVGEEEHPASKARNSMVNQLINLQRSMSINQLDSDARTLNAHGKKAAQQAKTKKKVSLLASL